MGLQYRDPDYSNNFIEPYPDLLLLSDSNGKFYDASSNIDDQNNGNGKLCGFSHDASVGDFDNDGDVDIYACNILLVNDGLGFFTFETNLDSFFISILWFKISSLNTLICLSLKIIFCSLSKTFNSISSIVESKFGSIISFSFGKKSSVGILDYLK